MEKVVSEFNSNKYVVERINEIIAYLNQAFNIDSPDEIIKWERAFLRELWPKLNKEERKIYFRLYATVLKSQAMPRDAQSIGGIGNGRIIFELEQIALELMDLADIHGLLMSNKDDPRLAVLKQ